MPVKGLQPWGTHLLLIQNVFSTYCKLFLLKNIFISDDILHQIMNYLRQGKEQGSIRIALKFTKIAPDYHETY